MKKPLGAKVTFKRFLLLLRNLSRIPLGPVPICNFTSDNSGRSFKKDF